jgi:hypothetical protein
MPGIEAHAIDILSDDITGLKITRVKTTTGSTLGDTGVIAITEQKSRIGAKETTGNVRHHEIDLSIVAIGLGLPLQSGVEDLIVSPALQHRHTGVGRHCRPKMIPFAAAEQTLRQLMVMRHQS